MNNRKLVLENKMVFEGVGFGCQNECVAEISRSQDADGELLRRCATSHFRATPSARLRASRDNRVVSCCR